MGENRGCTPHTMPILTEGKVDELPLKSTLWNQCGPGYTNHRPRTWRRRGCDKKSLVMNAVYSTVWQQPATNGCR